MLATMANKGLALDLFLALKLRWASVGTFPEALAERGGGGKTAVLSFHTETLMSADKDRAVRREKQKRAKDTKRAARQQRAPAKK